MYCMREKNVRWTQKALGHDSDSATTSLSLNIVNNITFKEKCTPCFLLQSVEH